MPMTRAYRRNAKWASTHGPSWIPDYEGKKQPAERPRRKPSGAQRTRRDARARRQALLKQYAQLDPASRLESYPKYSAAIRRTFGTATAADAYWTRHMNALLKSARHQLREAADADEYVSSLPSVREPRGVPEWMLLEMVEQTAALRGKSDWRFAERLEWQVGTAAVALLPVTFERGCREVPFIVWAEPECVIGALRLDEAGDVLPMVVFYADGTNPSFAWALALRAAAEFA